MASTIHSTHLTHGKVGNGSVKKKVAELAGLLACFPFKERKQQESPAGYDVDALTCPLGLLECQHGV
jgi:hypothetical protein